MVYKNKGMAFNMKQLRLFCKQLALLIATGLALPSVANDVPIEKEWKESAEANRVFAKTLFHPSWNELLQAKGGTLADLESTLTNISPAWLWGLHHFAQNPDARLFMLADPYNFSDESIARAALANLPLTQEDYEDDESWEQLRSYQFNQQGILSIVKIDLSPDLSHSWVLTYMAIPQPDSSLFGILQSNTSDRYANYDIMELAHYVNGKIKLSTPQLQEKDFFKNKEVFYPPLAVASKNDEEFASCEMYIHFDIDIEAKPFQLTASLKQANPNHYRPAFLCTAECEIPFIWNGEEFVAEEIHCPDKEKWGIMPPSFE